MTILLNLDREIFLQIYLAINPKFKRFKSIAPGIPSSKKREEKRKKKKQNKKKKTRKLKWKRVCVFLYARVQTSSWHLPSLVMVHACGKTITRIFHHVLCIRWPWTEFLAPFMEVTSLHKHILLFDKQEYVCPYSELNITLFWISLDHFLRTRSNVQCLSKPKQF